MFLVVCSTAVILFFFFAFSPWCMLRFLSFGHSLDVSLPAYHSIYFLDCTLRSLRVLSSASVPFRSFVLRCPAFPAAVDTSISPLEPQSRFWGQTSHIPSTLSPKRDCGPKRVNRYQYLVRISYTQPFSTGLL